MNEQNDAMRARRQLEIDLRNRMREFELATGLIVRAISVLHSQSVAGDHSLITVTTTVELP